MANNAWERIIRFKVEARDLKRAVDRAYKDIKKIDDQVGKVNAQFNKVAKVVNEVNKNLSKSTKELQKASSAARKLGSALGQAGKAAFGLSKSIINIVKGQNGLANLIGRVGLLDAALRSVSGHGLKYFERQLKNATAPLLAFGLAHAGVIAAIGGGAIVAAQGARSFYNLGKAARQAEVNVKQLYAAYKKGGFQALFPAGSRLGGDRSKEDIKRVVNEQKKLEKAAEKTQKQYKLAATGLNKLREQLDKTRKIQDQLLSSSKGYVNVSKKVLSIEQQITKEEQKRANIKRRMTWGKDLMKLATGRGGLAGKAIDIAGRGLAGGFVADAGIRKVSDLLGKQIGLWKASQIAASGFWKALQAIRTATGTAIGALDTYGRALAALIAEHQRGIQVVGGFSAGLFAVGKAAPGIYNLGKGFRQLVEDIAIANEKLRTGGWQNLFPRGSILGGGLIADKNELRGMDKAIKAEAIKRSQPSITSIGGLKARNTELERTRKIQENIDKFTTGWFQSVRQLGRAQVAYNRTLAESTLLQRALTLDIFAAQNAVKGMAGLLRGAAGLLKGGLKGLGGLLDRPIGRAAEGLAITKELEWLGKNIPFVTQKWRDQIAVVTKWAEGAVVGITSVRLAYAGLNKVLGAVGWADQSARQFVSWERQAARSFHNVAKAANDLSKDVFRALSGVENKFSWFKGPGSKGKRGIFGDVRGGTAKGGAFGDIWNPVTEKETGTRGLAGMEAALRKQVELRNNTLSTSEKYTAVQARILRIEEAITKEMARRGEIEEKMTQKKALGRLSTAVDDVIATVPKRIAAEKAYQVQKLNSARAVEEELFQQRLAANDKIAADRLKAEKVANQQVVDDWDRKFRNRQNRKQANQRMRENLMLGAGFPLLFGGGIGAVGGGVLGAGLQARAAAKGGGGAGGFGAQILFSAIGTQIDQFVGKIAGVGKALNDSTRDLSALQTAMALNGTAMGTYLQLLKESKGEHAALQEAMKVLESQVGEAGAKALKEFGNDAKRLADNWAIAMLKVQAALARFINWTGLIGKGKGPTDKTLLARANASTDSRMLELHAQGAAARATIENFSGGRMSMSGQSATGRAKARLAALDAEKIELQRTIELEKTKGAIYNDLTKELAYQIKLKKATSSEEVRQIENAKQVDQMLQLYVDKVTKAGGKLKEGTDEWEKTKKAIEEIVGESNKLDRIGDAMKQWKDRLDELKDPAYQLVQAADAIGNAFSDAFKGIVSGSMTAGEAFAAFTRSVANHFLDMAAEIAATALKHGIMKMLISAGFSSFGSTLGNTSNTFAGVDNNVLDSVIGNAGKYAQGGYVEGPTNALIGEGGEGEYVIPESKMNAALANYAGGARGDSVVPSEGGEGDSSGISGGGTRGSIDVSFNTQVINEVAYVSYAEFEAGVREAAAQGARMGESSTLKKLQNSSSVRRRVGV